MRKFIFAIWFAVGLVVALGKSAQAEVVTLICEGETVEVDTNRQSITISGDTFPARIDTRYFVYPGRPLKPGETLRRINRSSGQADAFVGGKWKFLGSCTRM